MKQHAAPGPRLLCIVRVTLPSGAMTFALQVIKSTRSLFFVLGMLVKQLTVSFIGSIYQRLVDISVKQLMVGLVVLPTLQIHPAFACHLSYCQAVDTISAPFTSYHLSSDDIS